MMFAKFRARRADRRAEKQWGPLTRDHCEVCGAPLRERQRVEITEAFDMEMTEFGLGGGGMTATYCPADAPKVEA